MTPHPELYSGGLPGSYTILTANIAMEIILASVMASWQLPESVDSLKTYVPQILLFEQKE